MKSLDEQELQRYSRQIALPQIGRRGQERLLNSSALILGAGGLGSPLAFYLCAAGVGRIGILDNDQVDLSNLQRQILHSESDIGIPKVVSAQEKLFDRNSSCVVETHQCRFLPENAQQIIEHYDLVIDAFDNFESKLLAAKTSWTQHKAHCYGGINAFEGNVMMILPNQRPCLHCLFKKEPKQNPPVGPFGAIAGLIACVQAAEAIKYLAGIGSALAGTLFYFDTLSMSSRKIPIKAWDHCPVCGQKS